MTIKKSLTIGIIGLLLLSNQSLNASNSKITSPFDHSNLAKVLSNHVNHDGLVDYQAIKTNPEDLDKYLQQLAAESAEGFKLWPEPEQVAFWINAYNAITLKVIVDHYPIKASGFSALTYPKNSIRQISGAWDKQTFSIMGEAYTLNHIEHKILRKQYNQPGIHMALVCAALSCPYLRTEPYTGAKLNKQLNDQTKRFLERANSFKINTTDKKVGLSSIFKWFGKDFIKSYGTTDKFNSFGEAERAVLNYIFPLLNNEEQQFLQNEKYSINYLHYDWTLNVQREGK